MGWEFDEEGVARGNVDPTWMQGRATFGGLVAALAVRSQRRLVPDLPLRTMHVDFIGPLGADAARVDAEVLRRGRAVTHARATIMQGDAAAAAVSCVFGDARPSQLHDAPRRAAPEGDPRESPDLPFGPGGFPNFTQFFHMAFREGLPYSGQKEARIRGWCRHRTEVGEPELGLIALLDLWPAPVLAQLRQLAPASSVTWTARLHAPPKTLGPEDWFWFESLATYAGEGYAGVRAELFDVEGRPLAESEQLVAVFDEPR